METMIVFQSKVDKHKFKVEEAVAMQFQTVKDHFITIKHKNFKEPTYRFHGISQNNLSKVLDYCKNHVDDDKPSFDIEFVKQLDNPVILFDLIQAAHYFKIKSLIDLTCRTLVDKVKRKTYEEIMKGFDIGRDYSRPSVAKCVQRVVAPRVVHTSLKEGLQLMIFMFARSWSPETLKFDQLLEPIKHLEELINRDLGLAYRLRSGIVRYLVMILKMTNNRRYTLYIQCRVVSILSRARFDICGDVLEKDAVPLLMKLVPKYSNTLATDAVIALTRLAYASPVHVKVIIDNGALEAVHEVINKVSSDYKIMDDVTKFLVAFCRGYNLYPDSFSSDKVAVVLTIIEDLFYKETDFYSYLACYALLYLSHGRCMTLTWEAYKRLIRKLTDFIAIVNTPLSGSVTGVVGNIRRWENLSKIVGSALGVVGNIARWGNFNQIQV
ncbi:hypothetical protein POM88_005059 [Heracleum sosnowskyi]|uniref:Uncharacterized protein n=1 Tax=Heracleum sosnowskyi TaxID=360622 RepID=A0AAD8ND47_9APIA|nr:hypothetical protein POM88_005059 [Heracleum sosnowskyi]